MNYYPHIDGLRAIAILLVLFFHGGLSLFPSGFIGVDIFFVISGFLITGIISSSLTNKNFSFIQFYCRRLWRLQPVFICMLLITSLMALFFYLPADLVLYGKSLKKSALYSSNSYFSNATSGYFAQDGKQLPLLHTWSLSIEWQCYFILPLLLYLLHYYLGQAKLKTVLYLLMVLSLCTSLYASYQGGDARYYQLSSRIFEFLIGSCVVLNSTNVKLSPLVLHGISGIAFLTLIYIAMQSGVSAQFPNSYALWVCLATAILIKAGMQEKPAGLIRILSSKWLVFIGLISYSLYIWHWPIFAFNHYMEFKGAYVTFAAFILTFIISYCSWRFIEKPARNGLRIKPVYTVFFLFLLPVAFTQLAAHFIKKQEGFSDRFDNITPVFTVLDQYNSKQREQCLVLENTPVSPKCTLGSKKSSSKTGFMVGDSFSNHYWLFMDHLAKQSNISILAQATGSCLVLPRIAQYDMLNNPKAIYKTCQQQKSYYYNMIKNNHYDYVILGENWNGYLGTIIVDKSKPGFSSMPEKKQMRLALEEALDWIIQSGARPVLIREIALSPKGNPYQCFLHHIKISKSYDPAECDYAIPAEHQTWINNLFAAMEKKYPQLIIIEPQKVLCDNNQCKADIDNIPVFRDAAHLTDYASLQLAKRYLELYKNPLLSYT